MDIKDSIWFDFVHSKYGDEYLCLYIQKQQGIRKWFKILTLLLSGGGIWFAFKDMKIPTVISCVAIGMVQLLTMLEDFIIHSDKDIQELGALRILYYIRANELEELTFTLDKLTDEEASSKFFTLRNEAIKIEELDNKLNVREHKRLVLKADIKTRNYLKQYHNE